MNWLVAKIYDRVMAPTEAACLRGWRREVVGPSEGRVLEIGAGTGANLGFYGAGVEQLVLVEPDQHMRQELARKVRREGVEGAQIVSLAAEALPVEDASQDVVVSTLVLCSVVDLEQTLGEVWRVLRPGGELRFLEHVAAHERPGRRRWQRRLEPVWKRVAGGCHLTRESARAIERAGFAMEELTRADMRRAPAFVQPTVRGVARKPRG